MRKNSKDESELPPLPKLPPPQIINENTINIYKTNVIKEFLSAFLRGRSTYADLKKAGIIKGYMIISLTRFELLSVFFSSTY